MRGRKPKPLKLTAKDVTAMQHLLRDGQTPQRVARRVRILLARAGEARVAPVAAKVELDPATVWRVVQRYQHGGLEVALYDAQRSGRPRTFFRPTTKAD